MPTLKTPKKSRKTRRFLTLGIETSCDETSAAVVADGQEVLSNVIATQIDLHVQTGGVVPEVAAREHVLKIIPILKKALDEANIELNDINLIGVTQGPGLLSSLLVGTTVASTLNLTTNIPVLGMNHIAGHIYGNWLSAKRKPRREIQFPVVILTVSGGHNELVLMKGHHEFNVLGKTRDDAAGEAFDKVARLLGLGYPGGPAISKAAQQGDRRKIEFPRAWLEEGSYDFSFSGLKTAVRRFLDDYSMREKKETARHKDQFVADVASGFQEAVCDVLATKLLHAVQEFHPAEIHLAGGVSANSRLRQMIEERLKTLPKDITFRYPESLSYCTDNAAMIASASYFRWITIKKYRSQEIILPDLQIRL